MVGYTKSFGAGDYDIWILKLDKNGEILWQKTYGSKGYDIAHSVKQITDAGYIVAGESDENMLIIKLDGNGNIEWQKEYGKGEIYSIQQTIDGGYILVGNTYDDILIVKLDMYGNVKWQKVIEDSSYSSSYSVQQTKDGYILAGYVSINRGYDVNYETYRYDRDAYIIKLDEEGNIQWQKTYGSSIKNIFGNYPDEIAYSIQQTNDGGYIVAGDTGFFDIWILKLDEEGNIQWQKTYSGIGEDRIAVPTDPASEAIQQTSDGGYIVVGYTNSFGDKYHTDIWILKLDEEGNIQWQKTYGGEDYDEAKCVRETSDGYIIAGETKSFGAGKDDFFVFKVDKNGNIPDCDLGKSSNANVGEVSQVEVIEAKFEYRDTYIVEGDTNIVPQNTYISPEWICPSTSTNKPPVIDSFVGSPTYGMLPLTVTFTCTAHDPDGNIVEYHWDFNGDGAIDKTTTVGMTYHTYSEEGTYYAQCIVVDDTGLSIVSPFIKIIAEKEKEVIKNKVYVKILNNDDDTLITNFYIDGELKHKTNVPFGRLWSIGSYEVPQGYHEFKITWQDPDDMKIYNYKVSYNIEGDREITLYISKHAKQEGEVVELKKESFQGREYTLYNSEKGMDFDLSLIHI